MRELFILAEEIAYLTSAHADVACRNILVRTYISVKLVHESLAETHDFGIALAARGKVGATLAATHGQRGEGVLEGLLKAQELHDRQVDGGVEPQSALVRAYGAVELHAVADVHLYLAVVVYPWHAELMHALGLYDALNNLGFLKLRMLIVDILNRDENFFHSL